MNVLGVITARGGSKGIPRKNLLAVHGKPLIAYTAETALASQSLGRVILSTDDDEIADMGRKLGVDVPFCRPSHLADDTTPTVDVLIHAINTLKKNGETFDAVFILQPTNPLRLTSDIDGAVKLMKETQADSVISFSPVGENHPARMKVICEDGQVIDPSFSEKIEGQRRQDLNSLYLRNGAVYLTKTDVVLRQNSIKGRHCQAWIIPRERSLNIDEAFDISLCEYLMTQRLVDYPGFSRKANGI